MRLTTIELYGFKSFPERTVISVAPGITAIVGRNGHGKSNIVDAIRWVLGERSARNIRGKDSTDVIFKGCDARKACSMAEVKLHFDNSDHVLGGEFGNYAEVCVQRRIFNTGVSEYYINSRKTTRRAIQELIRDTGLGNFDYSIINQGQVQRLLNAKPADRRTVFEEAAGIAGFKQSRKETKARLDKASGYAERLREQAKIKEDQAEKVRKSANDARRHKKLTQERKEMRTYMYKKLFAEQTFALDELRRNKSRINADMDAEAAAQVRIAAELTTLINRENELNDLAESTRTAHRAVLEQLTQIQLDQTNAANKKDTLSADLERSGQRRREQTERQARLTTELEQRRAELDAARTQLDDIEQRWAGQNADRAEVIRQDRELDDQLRGLRGQIIDANNALQKLTAQKGALETSMTDEATRRAALDEKIARLEAEQTGAQAALAALQQQFDAAGARAGSLANRMAELAAVRDKLTSRVEELRQQERTQDRARMELASRKSALEDLENNLEGTSQGVRSVLRAVQNGEFAPGAIHGMVIDLMTVPQDYAVALETVLGANAQNILTNSARDAQDGIEYLKRTHAGRATFLPLDRIQPRRRLDHSLARIPGVIGEAVDLVDFDPRYTRAMEYLLAGVLVVDNLSLARDIAGREARGVRIVTLDGDVINPSGAMTGGREARKGPGLVQRKAELDALAGRLAQCESALAATRQEQIQADANLRAAAEQLAAVETEMAELGRSESTLRQDMAVKTADCGHIDADLTEARTQRDSFESAAADRTARITDLEQNITQQSAELDTLKAQTADAAQRQHELRARLEQWTADNGRLADERSAASARVGELSGRVADMQNELSAVTEELNQPQASESDIRAQIDELARTLQALGTSEAEQLRQRDELDQTLAEHMENLADCRRQTEDLRRQETDSRTQTDRFNEAIQTLVREEGSLETQLANTKQSAFEYEGLDQEALADPAFAIRTPVDHETSLAEGLAAPAAPAQLELTDAPEWTTLPTAELRARIEELGRKIDRIPNPNPNAERDLLVLETSLKFMYVNIEEFEDAIKAMRETIDGLNQKSSQRFEETFSAVRSSFKAIFTFLFKGGSADLELQPPTDPDADPLDMGIEIIARPPGSPNLINSLSGGQRTLCSVALLLALFRSKPSPFCVLDEVDAPLDASNKDIYMDQIHEFCKSTQFIMITHSPEVMRRTDTLLGVLQEESRRGISEVRGVSVREMEKLARESAPAAAEQTDAQTLANAG